MAKKTKKRWATGLARVTQQTLRDGLPGPGGVRIRYAVPKDMGVVSELVKTAGDDMETGYLEALAGGRCGTWLLLAFLTGCGLEGKARQGKWRIAWAKVG
ncbi:hypothetical protein [Streptomyces albogriseolus]|uniref:hypothetical protein n=1 Tax=Streptomyces albogriseolus TaxID=1887 RepID=UPI00379EE459